MSGSSLLNRMCAWCGHDAADHHASCEATGCSDPDTGRPACASFVEDRVEVHEPLLRKLALCCGLKSDTDLADPAAALSTYIQMLQGALERIASLPRGEHGNCRFCDTNGGHGDQCPRGFALAALGRT